MIENSIQNTLNSKDIPKADHLEDSYFRITIIVISFIL
jgi:hypothetical protein